jgi:hypothetical protein
MILYTAIFGDTYELQDPEYRIPGVPMVAFSDRPLPHLRHWEVRVLPKQAFENKSSRLVAKEIKIFPERFVGPTEATIWMDSSFVMVGDPMREIYRHFSEGKEFLAFRHHLRDTLREEAVAIEKHHGIPRDLLVRQADAYKRRLWTRPQEKRCLTVGGFLVRRATPAILRFQKIWWRENLIWTLRDQMSLDFALVSAGVKYDYLSGTYKRNTFIRHIPIKRSSHE